jgi:hypothetical protein
VLVLKYTALDSVDSIRELQSADYLGERGMTTLLCDVNLNCFVCRTCLIFLVVFWFVMLCVTLLELDSK